MEDGDDDSITDSLISDDINCDILRPRAALSRTNWLYRLDTLRVHDQREM